MDRIQDPILGTVVFPKSGLIRKLIDLEVVQRTRHLNQLGLADLVFPTAHHTRFSHSLGVYELTRRMLDHLSIAGLQRNPVEAAALLHDVGHYPLSHTCEAAYPLEPIDKEEEALWADGVQRQPELQRPHPTQQPAPEDGVCSLLQFAATATEFKKGLNHERLGAEIVLAPKWHIPETLGKISPADVGNIFNGKYLHAVYGKTLSRLVKSQFDADRLDYLLRDARTIGSTYGVVEADRLISKLVLKEFDGTKYTAFTEDVIPALDHFMMSRYFAYQAIVFHKAVCCFDVLARALYMSLLHYNSEWPQDVDQLHALARGDFDGISLLQWDDHMYWQGLRSLQVDKDKKVDPITKTLLGWLFERRQPRVVWEERVGLPGEQELKDYKERVGHLKEVLPAVLERTQVDARLCFFHQSSKPIYQDPVLEWNERDRLPDSDSILVLKDGADIAGPLEAVGHSLLRQVANTDFRYFRVYAPVEKSEAVRAALEMEFRAPLEARQVAM